MSDKTPLAELHQLTKPKEIPVCYRAISDIQAKPIHWLWKGRMARGKVSMIAGNPGLGKSQITASMAAIVTNGSRWPVDHSSCEQGQVVFLSAEDDAADTIRPRLEATGAILEKVFIVDAIKDFDSDGQVIKRGFNLKTDLTRLGHLMDELNEVALLIVDPITAYLGGTDSHKNADIRALLSPLGDFASKYDVAIVCVSHLNKGGGTDALMRVSGSLAFVAAARAAFLVAEDAENGRRVFLPMKNNIGNDQSGLAFDVIGDTLPNGIETSKIVWHPEPITVTAAEVLNSDGSTCSALDDAKEFLIDELSAGGVLAKDLQKKAKEAGHGWRTIERAKTALGVKSEKGFDMQWRWRLPNE